MTFQYPSLLSALFALAAVSTVPAAHAIGQLAPLPNPETGNNLVSTHGEEVAVFGGGCFWGVENIFLHTKGVLSSTSGYAGGTAESANYAAVSSGKTAHAEVVRVVFDPSVVSYGQLLKVFFSAAHNPTELNRQGNDIGPQYRAAIFTTRASQTDAANAYVRQLQMARVFDKPIVTTVGTLERFFPAEPHHQGYVARNMNDPYVVTNDLPKLSAFRSDFAELYRP